MTTIPIDATPVQLRIVWKKDGTLQGADCTFLINGLEVGPIPLKDIPSNTILSSILSTELTSKIVENQILTEQVASLPSLQSQIDSLLQEKLSLQAQLDSLLNPPLPTYRWRELYQGLMVSTTYQVLVEAALQSSPVNLALTLVGFAISNGPFLPEQSALAAFQSSVNTLFSVFPLDQEQWAEVRTLLDAYNFNSIVLP